MSNSKSSRQWLTKSAIAWIITNALGAFLFLYFASKTWLEPVLQSEDVARSGDDFVWFLGALPFALACFIADFFMVGLALRTGRLTGNWKPMVLALIIGLGWAVAMIVDVSGRF